MTKPGLFLPLAGRYLSLSAWCQAPPQGAPRASQPVPSSFVEVEGSKLYYEECGTGREAVVLIHDGIAHSAVWDDVPARSRASRRQKTHPRFAYRESSGHDARRLRASHAACAAAPKRDPHSDADSCRRRRYSRRSCPRRRHRSGHPWLKTGDHPRNWSFDVFGKTRRVQPCSHHFHRLKWSVTVILQRTWQGEWVRFSFQQFAQYVSDQPTTVIVSTSNSTPVLTMLSVLPCPSK